MFNFWYNKDMKTKYEEKIKENAIVVTVITKKTDALNRKLDEIKDCPIQQI